MQTLTKMDMVFIEDYYHTITMDENVNWMKRTRLLSNFPLNLGTPFVPLPFTFFKCTH